MYDILCKHCGLRIEWSVFIDGWYHPDHTTAPHFDNYKDAALCYETGEDEVAEPRGGVK